MFKKLKNLLSQSEEVKASTAYLICSVLLKCMAFITLPLFTNIMSMDENGFGTVYSSLLPILIIFTSLNLPYGSFSTAMIKFENDRDGYISSVNTICILLVGIYFAGYLPFMDFWNDLAGLPSVLMILMGFEMLFSTSTQFWMGKARFEYKYKPFVKVTIIQSILGTAASICLVLILTECQGIARVIGYSMVSCIIGSVLLVDSIAKGKKCFNKTYWKYAISFNIPLIPYYLSQVIFNQSDRLMISSMTGRGDAAMYNVAYSLAFILTFVLNALNNSFVPWMYRKIKANDTKEIHKVSMIIAGIMSVLLLGVILIAPEFILIMSNPDYLPAVWVVPPVSMSLLLLFYSQLFINVEFYFEQKNKLVIASILSALVNIVLNYFGILYFGFVVAGYTTFLSYILFAVCNYFAMRKVCREKGLDENIYNMKHLVALLLIFSVVGFGVMALYPFRIIRYAVILVALVVMFIFRKKVIKIVADLFAGFKEKKDIAKEPEKEQTEEKA